MGVDYTAIAGYGIEITQDMCEKASTPDLSFNEGDSMTEFVDVVCWDTGLECADTGSYYSGDTQCWILISDPLNKDVNALIEQLNGLPFNLNIKSHADLEWVADLLVH